MPDQIIYNELRCKKTKIRKICCSMLKSQLLANQNRI